MTDAWYMGWQLSSNIPAQQSIKDAVQHFTKKYGYPPSEIIVAPDRKDIQPMEGYNFVVTADHILSMNTILVGVVENESEKVCLEGFEQ